MSASNAFESDVLKHFFQNLNIANLGDVTGVRGSAAAGNLYISLHTADPGEAGDQTTNECNYTGYARVAIPRDTSNWTVSGTAPTQVANANVVNFGQCGGGNNTVTYFAIGRDSSGAGEILLSGVLTASLAVSNGITPSFAAGALTATCD